jgi:fructose-1,6-bisphosphatase II / sedoheptulose-1,7-bisphosphatase
MAGGKTGLSTFQSMCTLEVVRATEAAAIAAASLTGRGDEQGADEAALAAMAQQLQALPVGGHIVIGEDGYSDSQHLQVGTIIGGRDSHDVDLAVMPLEGSSINARALSNALSVIAVAEKDSLLRVPSMYMEKIAVGPGYEPGIVGLERSTRDNIETLAKAKGVRPRDITVCMLDRARHGPLIEEVRHIGARIRLIGDGDIAGVIQTSDPDVTGIDMYMGIGGSDQGILAAAALTCVGGQMEGRLHARGEEDKRLVHRHGIEDLRRVYTLDEMVAGDVVFAATGVTDGYLLMGVRLANGRATTQSLLLRARTGTERIIDSTHRVGE